MKLSYQLKERPKEQPSLEAVQVLANKKTKTQTKAPASTDIETTNGNVLPPNTGPSETAGRCQVEQAATARNINPVNSLDPNIDRQQLRANPIQTYITTELKGRTPSPSSIGGPINLPTDRNFLQISFDSRILDVDLSNQIKTIIAALESSQPILIETQTTGDAARVKAALESHLANHPNESVTNLISNNSSLNPSPAQLHNELINEENQIIFTTSPSVDFNAKMITAPSGTGLTMSLAQIAVERFKQGEKILILANHEHGQRKIAQAILDFAEPALRQSILTEMQILQDNNRSINPEAGITVSTHKLLKKQERRDAIGLTDTKTILVDDAHSYISEREGTSNGLILENIIRETNSSKENPTELISASSTPADYRLSDTDDVDPNLSIRLRNLSPDANARITPSTHRTLNAAISDNSLRNFELITSTGLFSDGTVISGKADLRARLQDREHDDNLCDKIADWYENNAIKQDGTQKKFEVWAVNANAARAITETLRARDINAVELVKGSRGLSGLPNEQTGNLLGFPEQDPEFEIDDIEIAEQRILDEYSKAAGQYSVLVHCGELLKGYNSPQTEGVIIADAIESRPKLLRLIAATTSKLDQQQPDNRLAQILCLDRETERIISEELGDRDVNTINSKAVTGQAGGRNIVTVQDGSVVEISFSEELFSEANRTWLTDYLQPTLSAIYTNIDSKEKLLTKGLLQNVWIR